MKPKHILPLALALTFGATHAQTLSTEITVDRTVAPNQTAATPLSSVQPALLAAAPLSGDLALSDFGGDAYFASRPDPVSPFLYNALPGRSPFRGYASLGYFPAYRLGAQVGYALIDSKNTLLLASARFGGMSWHSECGDKGRNTVANNNFAVDARWLQRLGDHRLKASAEFSGAALKNLTYTGAVGNQNYTGFRADIALDRSADAFAYGVKADVDHFGASKDLDAAYNYNIVYTPASNTVFRADAYGRLGSDRIAGELSAGVATASRKGAVVDYGISGPDNHYLPYTEARDLAHERNTIGTFRLAATHSSEHIVLRLGVRADIATGRKADRFNLAPDFEATWKPGAVTRVFLTAGGGSTLNTLRERFDRTPYAPAWEIDRIQRIPFRATAGFAYAPGRGFRAGFEACFQRTIGAPMLLVSASNFPVSEKLQSVVYTPMNVKGAWFEVNAGYGMPDFYGLDISLSLRANVNSKPVWSSETSDPWSEDWGMPDNPDRASWVITLAAKANPIERLSVNLDWNLRTGRKIYFDDHRSGNNFLLGTVNNLSISGIYHLNERIDLGLSLENLLCQRYELMPYVQAASLTGLIGATVRF